MVKDDTRVETGNDDDDNKSVNEIGDKENSVCENVVDHLETGNDDDDNKSVDEMRDKENSLCEKGVVGTEIGNGHGGTSGETGNNVREQELDDVEQGSISHGASAQPITNIYEDISADETGEIENSDGKKMVANDHQFQQFKKLQHKQKIICAVIVIINLSWTNQRILKRKRQH